MRKVPNAYRLASNITMFIITFNSSTYVINTDVQKLSYKLVYHRMSILMTLVVVNYTKCFGFALGDFLIC